MTDIVDRLRSDKAMVPRDDSTGVSYYQTRPLSAEAADEIERLEHEKRNLHGHIKRLEDRLSEAEGGRQKLRTSLAKARDALEEAKWVARSALKGDLAEAREALDRIVRLYNYENYEEALLYADDIANAALKGEGEPISRRRENG